MGKVAAKTPAVPMLLLPDAEVAHSSLGLSPMFKGFSEEILKGVFVVAPSLKIPEPVPQSPAKKLPWGTYTISILKAQSSTASKSVSPSKP